MKNKFYLMIIVIAGLWSCQQEDITLNSATETIEEAGNSVNGRTAAISACLSPLLPLNIPKPTPYVIPAADNIVDYTIMIDGVPREYRLYVPPGYPSAGSYPLVFMFHGTGQTMDKIMNSTRWHMTSRNGGNFIVVYPQAESYDMIQRDGSIKNQTKWITENVLSNMADSTAARDDIKFFNTMLYSIQDLFKVNCRKIYACGFSNGGAFVKSELRDHFGHRLAATVSTGGIGTPKRTYPSRGKTVPHLETCGDLDAIKLNFYGYPAGASLPMNPNLFLSEPFGPSLVNFAEDCGLPAPVMPISARTSVSPGVTPLGVRYWGQIEFFDTDNQYYFRMLHRLTHAVPTPFATPSYRENYIPKYWAFMDQYSK